MMQKLEPDPPKHQLPGSNQPCCSIMVGGEYAAKHSRSCMELVWHIRVKGVVTQSINTTQVKIALWHIFLPRVSPWGCTSRASAYLIMPCRLLRSRIYSASWTTMLRHTPFFCLVISLDTREMTFSSYQLCIHHLLLTVETANTTHNSDEADVRSVLGLPEQQSNYESSQHTSLKSHK